MKPPFRSLNGLSSERPAWVRSVLAWLPVGVLLGALLWSYWPALGQMAHKWNHDPQYSHGYLVPLFSIALLWLRRDRLEVEKLSPSLWGLPILLAGIVMRLAAGYFYFEWFSPLSLIPCIAGVCLLAGGWRAFRWSWPAIGFLFFMIPLPYTLEVALRGPLRRIGTLTSTYLMQTMGMPALAQGNVIHVGNHPPIGVAEACSGLNMLMTFFALSVAVAFLIERPWWQRAVVVVSAVPVALVSNVVRITVTGVMHILLADRVIHLGLGDWVLFHREGPEFVNEFFHDWAGLVLMMPLALVLLGAELWLLWRLVIVEEEGEPLAIGVPNAESGSAGANRATEPVQPAAGN